MNSSVLAEPTSDVASALARPTTAPAARSWSDRFSLRTSAWIVLLVGAVITAVLAVGARHVHTSNEHRLLEQRGREVASVASTALTTVQLPLSSGAIVAETTHGSVASFRNVVSGVAGPGKQFASMSLWSVGDASLHPIEVVGAQPELMSQPTDKVRTFLAGVPKSTSFAVYNLLSAPERRLGYALASSPGGHYIVYAESVLPKDRRANIAKNSAFSDLSYALFLGTTPDLSMMLASSTGGSELSGHTESVSVPFGNTKLLVIISAHGELGGSLLAQLWWLLLILGVVLTVAATSLVERVSRQRAAAETLAAENASLFAAQRSVALTLQHSLLPEQFPEIRGAEFGARYVAGVEGIDIGGDWYDVIALDDHRMMVVVGDVSGRGLPAATAMASLRFAVRAYAAQGDAPGTILTKLSELVSVRNDGQFATVLCASIDLSSGIMTCANAGHPEPLLTSGDASEFINLDVDIPVGVQSGYSYVETVRSLPAKGTLLLYTDGLVERRGESLSEGQDRLKQAATVQAPLDALLGQIVERVIPAGSADDTALLGVRWTM